MSLREQPHVSFEPDESDGPTDKQLKAFLKTPERLGFWGKFIDLVFGREGKPHRK